MNKFVKYISTALVCTALGTSAYAQSHAFVYREAIYKQLPGFEKKNKQLDSTKQAFSAEIQTDRQKINAKYEALVKPYNVRPDENAEQLKARMNATDKEKLTVLLEEDKLLETRIKSYNALLQQQFDTDIKPYTVRVSNALESYAKKNKIDFIWTMEEVQKQLAYVNVGKDITAAVVELAK